MTKKETRGGAREGAGAPKGKRTPEKKSLSLRISLPAYQRLTERAAAKGTTETTEAQTILEEIAK